jgi:hypothetical protein
MKYKALKSAIEKLEAENKTSKNWNQRRNLCKSFAECIANGNISQVNAAELAHRIIELNKPNNHIPIRHDKINYTSILQMAKKFKTSCELIRYYLNNNKPFAGEKIIKL